jgi:hypothetical protein
MSPSIKEHWNKTYTNAPISQLGWFESRSFPSLQLIENCAIPKDSIIVDIGSGATTLTADLQPATNF